MTLPGVSVLDAAFALSVTGAAMLWPPLALVVAGLCVPTVFLLVDWRRRHMAVPPASDQRGTDPSA